MNTKEMTKQQLLDHVESLNAQTMAARFTTGDLSDVFGEIDFGKIVVKSIIGGVWGLTLGVCSGVAINAIALLSVAPWIQFALGFAVTLATIYVAFNTGSFVAEHVYDGSIAAIGYAKSGYAKVRSMFNKVEAPAFCGGDC